MALEYIKLMIMIDLFGGRKMKDLQKSPMTISPCGGRFISAHHAIGFVLSSMMSST
jgi:hypothetical protein